LFGLEHQVQEGGKKSMPYVDATGAKLYFEDHGDGYPVLFVHEFGCDIRQWEAQVRYFSRAYRCVTFNARGYPPSDVPEDSAMAHCQAMRPSLHDLRDALSEMAVPVLLGVGDEDVPCLETNLMLKSLLPNAGLWICPNTGHAINLEEPAAFNAHIESFLSTVERGSWRRAYPGRRSSSNLDPHRAGSADHMDQAQVNSGMRHSSCQ
jgi:pimeloyl-ACP methyl ester carboxylesterase